MAATTKRIVAWYNREEWELVYRELYSSDMSHKKHALEKVAVWKCRLSHKLSTAIECTWQIVSAQVADWSAVSRGHGLQQDQPIRMTYAMALIRFVNLLTEKSQTRQYAQPVHVLAEELGLPEWLVALRHDATHAGLPSLPVLRDASEFALSWLRESYWKPQREEEVREDGSAKSSTEPYSEEAIAHLFKQVLQAQIQDIQAKDSGDKSLRSLLIQLEKAVNSNRDVALEVLLEEGHMLPSVTQMEKLGIQVQDLLCGESLVLPHTLVDVWQPVLKLCHHLSLTPRLVETAARLLTEEGSLRDCLLAGWIATILTAVEAAGSTHTRDMDPVVEELAGIYRQPCTFHGNHLLRACLKYPNKFTAALLPCLFRVQDPSLPSETCDQLVKLCGLYAQPSVAMEMDAEEAPVYTLETIVKDLPQLSTAVVDGRRLDVTNENSAVQELKGIDFSEYPLGIWPGHDVTYTSLELPAFVNTISGGLWDTGHSAMETEEGHYGKSCTVEETSHFEPEPVELETMQKWTSEEMENISQSMCIY